MDQAREQETGRTDGRAPAPAPAEHPLRHMPERLGRWAAAPGESSLQRLLWFQVSQAMFSPAARGRPGSVGGPQVPRASRRASRRPDL